MKILFLVGLVLFNENLVFSRSNTLNDHLDHTLLALPHELECLLRLFEFKAISDEPLNVDKPT